MLQETNKSKKPIDQLSNSNNKNEQWRWGFLPGRDWLVIETPHGRPVLDIVHRGGT